MNISSLLSFAKTQIDTLDAEILLCEVLEISKTQLITQNEKNISSADEKKILFYIHQRKNGKSISEILQRKNFYGYNFIVSNDVLTPRPETEILVENAFEYIQMHNIQKIIDVGTGSGCIIITLALLLEKTKQKKKFSRNYIGLDISEKALHIAKKNVLQFHQEKNIVFHKSDLLSKISTDEIENACIVTNLPYIPETDILSDEVMNGDPELALFSGKRGSDIYTKFFHSLPHNFSALFFEFDPPQKEYFQQLLSQLFPKRKISFFSDYAGDERFGKVL